MVRYYSTQRPIGPGTFPRKDGKEVVINFDKKTYCEEIGREAWGYIEYSQSITAKEAEAYELVVGKIDEYMQLCVWPGVYLGNSTEKEFETWFKEMIGVRVKFENEVVTNGSVEQKEEGGRHDLLFYVHNEDVPKFAIERLQLGVRWWEDVVKYNDGAYLYTKDVLNAYPARW